MTTCQTSGTSHSQGLYVASVAHGNSFKVGDRIVAIGGEAVATYSQMQAIITAHQAGDMVTVTVMRDGRPLEIAVPLTDAGTPAGATGPAA